ncbi:MAG TPA: hypothetical protein VEZ20_01640 [Allosphingosinicella sp.]|nr:hypothetical protein [Allosphingosinicella sp.]
MAYRIAAIAAFLLLAAACGDTSEANAAQGADPRQATAWTIGPIINGRNYSVNMPLHPTPRRGGGWEIDLPRNPGSVHYVTFPHGSLAGKTRIRMRYRIEADPGVRILPSTDPNLPSILTLYFQRAGDNWRARGRYETYRWYATFASHSPLAAGTREIVAPLNGGWTAVGTSTVRTAPAAFRDALAEADQVGFVLGGGDGYGHGVFATGRARLIVTEFAVE